MTFSFASRDIVLCKEVMAGYQGSVQVGKAAGTWAGTPGLEPGAGICGLCDRGAPSRAT